MTDPDVEILLKEYEQVNENFRMLADIRFKLLALVPALGGAAAFVLSGFALSKETTAPPHSLVLMIGLMGFVGTLGITIYDERNSELYDALISRAKYLEEILKLPPKGQFRERPGRSRYLFESLPIGHDIGLSIIYGPVLGAWAFPVAYVVHSLLRGRLHWGWEPRYVALGMALLMGIVFTLELLRQDKSLPLQKQTQEGNLETVDLIGGDLKLSYRVRNLPFTLKGKMTAACKEHLIGNDHSTGKIVLVSFRKRRTKTAGGKRDTYYEITKVIFPAE